MPHLLIAGTTGSGKSVTVHSILTSLLYRNSPDMLKFIMVDAKRVELTLYNKIPHLLTPVITDAKKTIMALRWAAKEMDRRYDLLEKRSVRDINSYHTNILAKDPEADLMPYIVIVIDELADLMQAYPRELEGAIVRLAQMSRAVGIHLILSTQRPSVNVITGLIKANIPTRIALKVGSQIDSRTIIDRAGAEKLVGQGDMLYMSQDSPDPIRVQSPYISEDEVKEVVKYFVEAYKDEVPTHELNLDGKSDEQKNPLFDSMNDNGSGDTSDDDELYEDAKQLVIEAKRASTSYIQRKLRVGYARAARLMDMLEERGVIAPGDGSAKPREVLDSGNASSNDETGA
jgi:S-DNA-T family DNA segregation ATPase FtsK/SpoIIIE